MDDKKGDFAAWVYLRWVVLAASAQEKDGVD